MSKNSHSNDRNRLLKTGVILAALLLLCVATVGAASAGQTGDITWEWNGTGDTVTYTGTGTSTLGSDAVSESISGHSGSFNAVIGTGITSIGREAFSECSSLSSVTFAADNVVESIGHSAFYKCSNLTSVTFGDSSKLTSIGYYAFENCSSLSSIVIPNNVTSIGKNAFYNCSSLSSITIPNSVTSIGNYMFYNCSSLSSITIPNNVTSIGVSAFENCSSLSSITIPNSVTTILSGPFNGCTLLESISVESENTHYVAIDGVLFTKDEKELVQYPAGKKDGTGKLVEEYTIPDSVTTIWDRAFRGCIGLKVVTIPESVTSIGDGAFMSCSKLESIFVDDNNTSYTDNNEGVLFQYTYPKPYYPKVYTLIQYPCGKKGAYSIPDGILYISNHAFRDCTNLTSVTIPASVTSVGYDAFMNLAANSVIYSPSSTITGYLSGWYSEDTTAVATLTWPNLYTFTVNDTYFPSGFPLSSANAPVKSGKTLDGWQNAGGSPVTSAHNGDTLTASWIVAKIGDTKYGMLQEAINAVPTDGTETTIVLLSNINECVTISENRNVVLDLAGFVINGNFNGSVITVESGASLNLKDTGSTTHYFKYASKDYQWTLYNATPVAGKTVKVYDSVDTFDRIEADAFLNTEGNKVCIKVNGGCITGGSGPSTSGGGGVLFNSTGTFTMNGGNIVGNESYGGGNGGGVCIYNHGSDYTFTMEGGTIAGNIAGWNYYSGSGGGVYIYNSGGTARFLMKGGTIAGNTSLQGYGSGDCYGGGVYISNHGSFELVDGTVTGNKATYGGGVYIDGAFDIIGGTISGNKATYGGGVYNNILFFMHGGTISGNTAYYGGGVDNTAIFNMIGGSITGNTGTRSGSGVFDNGTMTVCGTAKITGNAGSNLYLPDGKTITLENDPALTGDACIGVTLDNDTGDTGVFTVEAAANYKQFFSSDINSKHIGVVASGIDKDKLEVVDGGGEVHKHSGLEFTAWDSTASADYKTTLPTSGNWYLTDDVTLSSTWNVSGTVSVPGNVSLCMNGHVISRSSTASGTFNLITVGSGSMLNLYDCGTKEHYFQVSDGTTPIRGVTYPAGLWVWDPDKESSTGEQAGYKRVTGGCITGGTGHNQDGGGGVYVDSGTFTLNSGNIIGNTTTDSGGGVLVSGGIFAMSGGDIAGNTAVNGGGVSITNNGDMIVGGTAKITGNTNGTAANNVYLNNGKKITVNNGFAGCIGVTTQSTEYPVAITGANSSDYHSYFTSDNSNLHIINIGTGSDQVVNVTAKTTVTLDQNGATTESSPKTLEMTCGSSTVPSITNPTRTGYTFGGWTATKDSDIVVINTSGATEKSVAGWTDASGNWIKTDATAPLYAKWTAGTTNVTLNQNGATIESFPKTLEMTCGSSTVPFITNPTRAGYTFGGWTATKDSDNVVITDTDSLSTTDVSGWVVSGKWANTNTTGTLYAKWISNDITIGSSTNGHISESAGGEETTSTISPVNTSVAFAVNGAKITITTDTTTVDRYAVANSGYHFNEWQLDGTRINNGDIQKAGELTAVFKQDVPPTPATTYSVKYIADGEQYGSVDSYSAGSTVTVRAKPAKEGYTYSDWSSSDVAIVDGQFTMPSKSVTLTTVSVPEEEEDEETVIPNVPSVQVKKDSSGKITEIIATKGDAYEKDSTVIIEQQTGTDNVQIIITNAKLEEGTGSTDTVKLNAEGTSEISIVYPQKMAESDAYSPVIKYQITMPVNDVVTDLPAVSGAFVDTVRDAVKKAVDKDAIAMVTASENTDKINAAMENGFTITLDVPASLISDTGNLQAYHVTSAGKVEEAEIPDISRGYSDYKVKIHGTTYSSYVLTYSGGTDPTPSSEKKSSSTVSFAGEKSGNDFTFNGAVVITKATLPGATSARITNNGSGTGWYKFTLSTDGFTGNGTLYFQVPLDQIEIEGYTVNDVSLFGCTTKYLSTEGTYAKYSASVEKDGTYTIGFEKDAASAGTTPAAEVKPVEVSVTLSGVTAMNVGDTTVFSAKNSDGSSAKFAWKSSDESVASVDENGTVKALKAGTATITVTNNVTGKTASKTVTVAAKATETKTTTESKQTTKSPIPVLGILAGLGAASALMKRRKL